MQLMGQEESSLAEPMAGMGCVENCTPGAQGQGAEDGLPAMTPKLQAARYCV